MSEPTADEADLGHLILTRLPALGCELLFLGITEGFDEGEPKWMAIIRAGEVGRFSARRPQPSPTAAIEDALRAAKITETGG